MPKHGAWRNSAAYEYLNELDAPDLAWEFLRRNSDYQREYATLRAEGLHDESIAIALGQTWGLSFRSRPRNIAGRCQDCLDTCRGPLDADPSGENGPDCPCAKLWEFRRN